MEPRLIAMTGPVSGASLALTSADMSVGRDEVNDVMLADVSVSVRQCLFAYRDGRVTICDLDRSNPSFVNGLPAGTRTLADGDAVQIGQSLFVLRCTPPDEVATSESVGITEGRPLAPLTLVMRREEVFANGPLVSTVSATRLSQDLTSLI